MFVVEIYAAVRKFVFIEGHSRREAARVFGLNRETVLKMCRFSLPPGYIRTKPPEKPKLGPLLPVIDAILEADRDAPPKQRHSAKRIFERLRDEHGFLGGYTVVKDHVRVCRARGRETFVPLSHPPGHLERNRYSVPASFANRPVSLRVYPDRVVLVAEGQAIGEHRRVFARSHDHRGETVYDWHHYLSVVQRKPGALRNGAPFAEMPDAFRLLQQHLLKTPGGDREMVEILALVLQHDEQAVLTAVELALEAGVPAKTHIINLLHRLIDAKPLTAPTVELPQTLTLTTEPRANVERYDALCRTREVRHAP